MTFPAPEENPGDYLPAEKQQAETAVVLGDDRRLGDAVPGLDGVDQSHLYVPTAFVLVTDG